MSSRLKYGKVWTELKELPKDEPVFLLRGQDKLAPATVRVYAALRRAAGDIVAAEECERVAQKMDEWTYRKMPD